MLEVGEVEMAGSSVVSGVGVLDGMSSARSKLRRRRGTWLKMSLLELHQESYGRKLCCSSAWSPLTGVDVAQGRCRRWRGVRTL